MFIVLALFLFVSCSYDCKITNLKHRNLTYHSLPESVKNGLNDAFEANFRGCILTICKEDSTRYNEEHVWNFFVHSWLEYVKVTDQKKNII